MARTKKIRLTKRELNLLLNPPTPQTWICPNHIGDKGINFPIYNNGNLDRCWLCRKTKPKRAKKVWTDYVAVCKKVSIEPGTSGTVVKKLLKQRSDEVKI